MKLLRKQIVYNYLTRELYAMDFDIIHCAATSVKLVLISVRWLEYATWHNHARKIDRGRQ